MIIYNLRYNGPYEYDKFILNVFQLYNLVEEEKEKYAAHPIHEKLTALNKVIKEMTQYEAESRINTRLDRLLMEERLRGRK